jgi:hypothetical protein
VRRENHDAGGEEDGFRDRMGDEDNGPAMFLLEAQQLFIHAVARYFVQSCEGLIHEKDARTSGESAGNGDAHLHATGELPGI